MNTSLDLDFDLSELADGEVVGLSEIATRKLLGGTLAPFWRWVQELAETELEVRHDGGDRSSIRIPDLTYSEAADFVVASWTFANMPLTEQLSTFADEVLKHGIVAASAMLQSAHESVGGA